MKRTDLARYVDLVRRRWQMLVLIVAVVVGASLLQSLTSTKQYETSSRVIILEQGPADVVVERPTRDLGRALQTERRALDSQSLRADVEAQLRREVDVRFGTQSPDLLLITARDSDPAEAAVAANVYAQSFVEFRKAEGIERLNVTRRQLLAESELLDQRITALEQALDENPGDRAAAVSLNSRVAQQADFRGQIDKLDFLIASETGGLDLGEAATVPASPVSPRPVRGAAFAFVLGSILALGVALALEALDDTVRSSRRLAGLTKGAPVLGVIPPYGGSAPTIATLDRPDDPATEAYSNLRTAFLAVLRDQTRPIVQVTSAGANEGKSVVATNLAVTLSQIGLRVALVDADLRNPSLRRFFPQLPETGLAEILEGELPIDTQLSDVGETMVLHALPAGLPEASPAELLSSPTAKQVFGRIAVEHDVTIIDTSTVIGYADANVIAALADFTLMVVRAGETKSEQVRRAFDALALIDARPLGVVLTDSRDSAAGTETAIAPARRIRRRGADRPELVPVAAPESAGVADDGNVRQLTAKAGGRGRRGQVAEVAGAANAEVLPIQPDDPVPTPVALYDVEASAEPTTADPSATARLGTAAAIAAVQQTARADESDPAPRTAANVPPAPPPETTVRKPEAAPAPAPAPKADPAADTRTVPLVAPTDSETPAASPTQAKPAAQKPAEQKPAAAAAAPPKKPASKAKPAAAAPKGQKPGVQKPGVQNPKGQNPKGQNPKGQNQKGQNPKAKAAPAKSASPPAKSAKVDPSTTTPGAVPKKPATKSKTAPAASAKPSSPAKAAPAKAENDKAAAKPRGATSSSGTPASGDKSSDSSPPAASDAGRSPVPPPPPRMTKQQARAARRQAGKTQADKAQPGIDLTESKSGSAAAKRAKDGADKASEGASQAKDGSPSKPQAPPE